MYYCVRAVLVWIRQAAARMVIWTRACTGVPQVADRRDNDAWCRVRFNRYSNACLPRGERPGRRVGDSRPLSEARNLYTLIDPARVAGNVDDDLRISTHLSLACLASLGATLQSARGGVCGAAISSSPKVLDLRWLGV